jgi:DNA polymerase-3 subunit epsilon
MLSVDFAVLDVETTGIAAFGGDRVVERAILRCRPNVGIIDRFVTLVDPGGEIAASAVHGLRRSDVCGAPSFAAIADAVVRRLEGSVIVAHNSRFDVAFVQAELARLGRPSLRQLTLCTIGLVARLGIATPGRSLRGCCAAVGVDYDETVDHSAGRDARVTALLLLNLLREARAQEVLSLIGLGCVPADVHAGRLVAPDPPPACPPSARVARAARRLGDVTPVGDGDVATYLDLVDRVLADRVITAAESDALRATARRLGLADRMVEHAHGEYVRQLEELAWADGVLDADEADDLRTVGRLLGVKEEATWKS